LQHQIVSPNLLVETLWKSISVFPKDAMSPFTLSKDSISLISRICDVQIYTKDGILGYVINLPLITRDTFKVGHVAA
jgi:hypothetical protein